VAVRMIPVLNRSAWPRENDSRSQDPRDQAGALRMILVLTREGACENDSHF